MLTAQEIKESKVFQKNVDDLIYTVAEGFVNSFENLVWDIIVNELEGFGSPDIGSFTIVVNDYIGEELEDEVINDLAEYFAAKEVADEIALEKEINYLLDEISDEELMTVVEDEILSEVAYNKLRDFIYDNDWAEEFDIESDEEDDDDDEDEDYDEDEEEYDESLT